ncbi:MAG TPA: DUF4412 domain-containing protein, partial [Flavobacteriales bacterium]|nr:DUF4412 domain-containing protein [Flavobacteriales bacterium]
YTLMTDDKGKRTALKSHKKKIMHTADKDDAKKPEVIVTTETKVIEGHTCTKVIVKSEDGTWTGWVTKDIAVPFGDLMRSMRAGRSTAGDRDLEAIQGFPLEYEWVKADGTDKMVVYVKDLAVGTVNEDVFSLDGYEVKELPSYGR